MTPAPVVSVGVPVYNGEAFLSRCLTSLSAQTFRSLEIIVSDNASTDGTAEVVRRFMDRDTRISYHRNDTNRGAAWNFNRTFQLSRGRYFKWAAADDECRPEFVARCVDVLERADRSTVLCYPRTYVIDAESRVTGDFTDAMALEDDRPSQRLARFLRCRTEYHPVFGVIRTEALRRTQLIGGFVASDVALLAELAIAGRFVEIPERLFGRRFHAATSVNANPHPGDRAAWFDPASRGSVVLPVVQLTRALARCAWTADIDPLEKVRCLASIGRHWLPYRWRDIGGEIRLAGRAVRPLTAAGR